MRVCKPVDERTCNTLYFSQIQMHERFCTTNNENSEKGKIENGKQNATQANQTPRYTNSFFPRITYKKYLVSATKPYSYKKERAHLFAGFVGIFMLDYLCVCLRVCACACVLFVEKSLSSLFGKWRADEEACLLTRRTTLFALDLKARDSHIYAPRGEL